MSPTYTMPEFSVYPEFVPDQVLTSDHLNELFDYLDEQERMTRASLLGIGIVCGLEIKSDATSITITKGSGVTSEGYLVRQEKDITYNAFRTYDPVKKTYYEKLVNTSGTVPTQRFALIELKKTKDLADDRNLSEIAANFSNYVVLLFVELLEDQNKNCDPASCDDKGITIEATIRPLLMVKSAADLALVYQSASNPQNQSPFLQLPDLRLPRYDLPRRPSLTESLDVLSAYTTILAGTDAVLQTIKGAITGVYAQLPAGVTEALGNNPFAGLPAKFLPDFNTRERLLHLQYYYDLVFDLLQAYDEFRKLGNDLLSACCPDAGLFPRHLLLGDAVPSAQFVKPYRHVFLYSPLFQKRHYMQELRFLAGRIRAIIDNNNILLAGFKNNLPTAAVRATPSMLWDVPLSQKAIPYYFNYDALSKVWNFNKALRQKEMQNLGYAAQDKNGVDDWVKKPLQFDLEPYNFLRIEGHIGKEYTGIVNQLKALKKDNHLPIDILALSAGEPDLSKIPQSLLHCNIRDLEVSYEIIRREWEAVVGQMIEYIDDVKGDLSDLLGLAKIPAAMFAAYASKLREAKKYMDAASDLRQFVIDFDKFLSTIYEPVEKQSEDLRALLVQLVSQEKELSPHLLSQAEDLIDHLDEVILSCKKGGFRSIRQQLLSRLEEIYSYLFFGTFVEKHPGIQHKAGVPLGGTFILVYHKKKTSGIKGPFTLQGRVQTVTGLPLFGGTVGVPQTNISTMITGNGTFSLVVPTLPVVLRAVSIGGPAGALTGELLVTSQTQSVTIQVPSLPVTTTGGSTVFDTLEENKIIADFYLPYLCSSNCTPIQFVIQEQVNHAPVANAGPDQVITLPQNATMLDGRASTDPEKGPLTYAWTLVSGQQNVVLASTTEAKTGVSNLAQPGEYIFELTVTDDMGRSSADRVTVTVRPKPNNPPTADAGDDRSIQLPQNAVTLQGSGDDPEKGSLTFLWTKEQGPEGGSIADPSSATTEVTGLTEGEYIFKLTVADDQHDTGTDTVKVTVLKAENRPPTAVASASATVINVGESVTLLGSGTDPENRPLEFLWSQTGGLAKTIIADPAAAQTLVSQFTMPGSYSFKLVVKDDGDNEDDAVVTLAVEAVNRPPVARIKTPINVLLPDAFAQLDGTGSFDPENAALTYLWGTKEAGIRITNKTSPTPIAYGFTSSRPYEVHLEVQDDAGQPDGVGASVSVDGERREKSCLPLEPIEKAFKPYSDSDSELVVRLQKAFPALAEMQNYFSLLVEKNVAGWPLPQQTDFFRDATFGYNGEGSVSEEKQITIIEAMRLWLEKLLALVQATNNREISSHALTLVRILCSFAAYMGCIQRDPEQQQVPVTDLFKWFFETQLPLLEALVQKLDNALLLQVVQLRCLFDDEIFVIDNSGQASEKATYREVLVAIRERLDQLLDF